MVLVLSVILIMSDGWGESLDRGLNKVFNF